MKDSKWKILSKIESGIVCGRSTDIAITEFRDKYFIVISENGKIGSLIQVLQTTDSETLYHPTVLLGKDEPNIRALACSLVETCKLTKPVIIGFSLKEYSGASAKDLRKIINKMLEELPREAVHSVNCTS